MLVQLILNLFLQHLVMDNYGTVKIETNLISLGIFQADDETFYFVGSNIPIHLTLVPLLY